MRVFPRLILRLVCGALAVFLLAIGVVYAATAVETRAGLPGCRRTLPNSDTQDGHATAHLLPPRVHCSFARDDVEGVAAAHSEHFATVWAVILAIGAAFVIPSLLLAAGFGEANAHS